MSSLETKVQWPDVVHLPTKAVGFPRGGYRIEPFMHGRISGGVKLHREPHPIEPRPRAALSTSGLTCNSPYRAAASFRPLIVSA